MIGCILCILNKKSAHKTGFSKVKNMKMSYDRVNVERFSNANYLPSLRFSTAKDVNAILPTEYLRKQHLEGFHELVN